jgi:hypothetical protein
MAVTAPGSGLWVLSTPESARADAKSVTSSSKSVTHGRPHDSDDTLGASFSPAPSAHVSAVQLQERGGDSHKPSIRNFRFRPCLSDLELKPAIVATV